MLNHDPNGRPTAVEARLKYKEFVEKFAQIEELLEQLMEIGNKPTKGRNRYVRRRRLSRRRNVK